MLFLLLLVVHLPHAVLANRGLAASAYHAGDAPRSEPASAEAATPVLDPCERLHSELEVRFVELSRLSADVKGQLTEFTRVTPGDSVAYVTGLSERGRWLVVNPYSGHAEIHPPSAHESLEIRNVSVATGSPRFSRHHVIHDNRISTLTYAGDYVAGQLAFGRALAATTNGDGVSVIVFAERGDPPARHTKVLAIGPDGAPRSGVYLHTPDPFKRWDPWVKSIGVDRIYVANRLSAHEIAAYDFQGKVRAHWTNQTQWFTDSVDEFGRLKTIILAINEIETYILVVTAVRKREASGLFGGLGGFENKNSFYLQVLDRADGRILATYRCEKPPFYGGVFHDVVFRLIPGTDAIDFDLVFLKVELSLGRRS